MASLPVLTPTNFAEAMQFANELAKSTMVPPAFQKNAANILVAIQWGAELGLGPLQALQNIAVIQGKPAVYGDAMLALVRGSPLCEDIIERIKGEGDLATAVCEARRKGATPVIAAFSVHDAKKAGLWGKAGPWTQYPLRMLQMRARGFALRDAFADILRGVVSAEEAADMPREAKDITPQEITAELDAFAAVGEAHVADVTDVAPDQAEADQLLADARLEARKGQAAFRTWYENALDDEQRTALSPHVRNLQGNARLVDRRRKRDEPTDEIDRLTAREAQDDDDVEPPPDYTAEDLPAPEAATEASAPITQIKPVRLKAGGWDWPRYTDDYVALARSLPRARLGEFRAKQAGMFEALHQSNKEEWSRASQAVADYEREGA